MSKLHTLVALIAVVFLGGMSASMQAQPPSGKGPQGSPPYGIYELDSRDGLVEDINGGQEMVGYVQTVDGNRPYYWSVGTASGEVVVESHALSIGQLGAVNGKATGMGAHICGTLEFDNPAILTRAVIWLDPASEPALLPAGEGYDGNTVAHGISPNGVVVGMRMTVQEGVPVFWTALAWGVRADGSVAGPIELGPGQALAIDDLGSQVTGFQGLLDRDPVETRAWYWGLTWDGDSLAKTEYSYPLFGDESLFSIGNAINNQGWTAGTVRHIDETLNGAFARNAWTFESLDLPQLVNDENYYTRNDLVYAMNNQSPPQLVGDASVVNRSTGGLNFRKVMWRGSEVIDLVDAVGYGDSKIPISSPAYPGPFVIPSYTSAINDNSWIVGRGWRIKTTGTPPIVMIPTAAL